MQTRWSAPILAAGTLILASACSDRSEPTAPDSSPADVSVQPELQGASDDPIALGRHVPGFGGFYLDEQGTPVVYLKNPAERGNAERALAPFLQRHGMFSSRLRVLSARYDFDQLEAWLSLISGQVLSVPGAVFVDANEATNRVTIGLERGALARARGVIARLRIPEEAVGFQETEPVRLMATLRGKIRPVVGGLQINFPGFLCSIGFNALRSGQRSFITASHCTNRQGGVESTPYYQPTQAAASAKIATEVSDPGYSQNKTGCPPGYRCRFSDASRAAYAAGTNSTLGRLAKTTGPNNNSITINGSFTITAEGNATVGETVGKVGRTTGWTTGKVTNTCVNVGVSGTDFVQLCQNIVKARVGSGDSGAPVFKGSGSVKLLGLLWGGDPKGTEFVYSPMANIERELGALTTF
jgi:hypothetical protein